MFIVVRTLSRYCKVSLSYLFIIVYLYYTRGNATHNIAIVYVSADVLGEKANLKLSVLVTLIGECNIF